ncbi:formyl transferase [Rhizobium cremeum]|uniref:formyl transferase n=1 Tax=Rhizobium cremeum TaxID=2813827 RepID=UPI000DDC8B41
MTERSPTVLLLTAGGTNPAIVANALATRFPGLQVVIEASESKWGITRRRARRLGWPNALGQLATMIAARLLRRLAARRTSDLVASSGYSGEFSSAIPQHEVSSINDESCVALVQALQPKAILLVSTRLMSPAVLAAMPCPVLNLHAGINPAYRGQMGGYWSLVEGDRGNFGATVHLVDAGTDTGGTLYEVRTSPQKGDFISTYPLVLTIASLDITRRAVEDALSGRLAPYQPGGPSALRFPPAIWDWLRHGLARGVW